MVPTGSLTRSLPPTHTGTRLPQSPPHPTALLPQGRGRGGETSLWCLCLLGKVEELALPGPPYIWASMVILLEQPDSWRFSGRNTEFQRSFRTWFLPF